MLSHISNTSAIVNSSQALLLKLYFTHGLIFNIPSPMTQAPPENNSRKRSSQEIPALQSTTISVSQLKNHLLRKPDQLGNFAELSLLNEHTPQNDSCNPKKGWYR